MTTVSTENAHSDVQGPEHHAARRVGEIVSFTAKEVAAMLGVSKEYVLKKSATGEWPSWRDGRIVRFLPEHLEAIRAWGCQPRQPLTRQPRRRRPVG